MGVIGVPVRDIAVDPNLEGLDRNTARFQDRVTRDNSL